MSSRGLEKFLPCHYLKPLHWWARSDPRSYTGSPAVTHGNNWKYMDYVLSHVSVWERTYCPDMNYNFRMMHTMTTRHKMVPRPRRKTCVPLPKGPEEGMQIFPLQLFKRGGLVFIHLWHKYFFSNLAGPTRSSQPSETHLSLPPLIQLARLMRLRSMLPE